MGKKSAKKYLDETPLDDYERELMKFLDKGEFVRAPDFEENKKMMEEAAARWLEFQESKSITLRVKKKDLIRLQAKAVRNNMPYQTLINLLINNYAEGKTRLII